MNDHMLPTPRVAFPQVQGLGQTAAPASAYRTAYDLLERRAPKEALEVLEPALEKDPDNTGLLSLRAWAYFIRVQLKHAQADLERLERDELQRRDPAEDDLPDRAFDRITPGV